MSSDNNTVPELLSYLIQRINEISQKLLQTSNTEVCYHHAAIVLYLVFGKLKIVIILSDLIRV